MFEWDEPRARGAAIALCAIATARLAHPGVETDVGVSILFREPELVAGLALAIALRPSPRVLLVIGLVAATFVPWRVEGSMPDVPPSQTLVDYEIRLLSDPIAGTFERRFRADVDGRVVRVSVPAQIEGDWSRGDHLTVDGVLRASPPDTEWAWSVGQVAELRVHRLKDYRAATGLDGVANGVRSRLRDGGEHLPRNRRPLYRGLVYGDDRGQGPVTIDDFRAAGLGHLLAVSGQNVVFLLALLAPALDRIHSMNVRVVLIVSALVVFGLVTRLEPSVLRAISMAGLVVVGRAIGRPVEAIQVLVAAVVALLIASPALALSLGFRLSVLATLGLIMAMTSGAPNTSEWRLALRATVAAQVAVAPLAVGAFGTVSVIALPANLIAGPVAGFVMGWGMSVGVLAGFAPDQAGTYLQLPARLAVGWIAEVASFAAAVPVAAANQWAVAVVVVGALMALMVLRADTSHRLIGALMLIVLSVVLLDDPSLPPGAHRVENGVTVIRSPGGVDVVVVDGPIDEVAVLAALRAARVSRIDLLIARDGGRGVAAAISTLRERHRVIDVWAPSGHRINGARVHPISGGHVGDLRIGGPGEPIVDSR